MSLKTLASGQTDDCQDSAGRRADSREARLRRSLRRLGYDLVDADARGLFYIQGQGSKVDETPDLFGLDLAGIEQWIRVNAPKKRA